MKHNYLSPQNQPLNKWGKKLRSLVVALAIISLVGISPNIYSQSVTNVASDLAFGGRQLSDLIDGSNADEFYFDNNQNFSSQRDIFRFTFNQAAVATSFRFRQDINTSFMRNGVVYRVEGSNNGSSWTAVSGDFTSTGSTTGNRVDINFSNSTAYTQYRIRWISGGSITWDPFIRELEFTATLCSGSAGGATSVAVGGTANVTPASGGTWGSSNNAIATVTNAGVVTGVAEGSVVLTFTDTSNNCVYTRNISVIIDTDNDGIQNTSDLDDDNDGILDTDERIFTNISVSNTTFNPNLQQWQSSGVTVTAGSQYTVVPTSFSEGFRTVSGGPYNGQSIPKMTIHNTTNGRWTDLDGNVYDVNNFFQSPSGSSVALGFANLTSGDYLRTLRYLGMIDVNGNGQYNAGTDQLINNSSVFSQSGNVVFTAPASGQIYLVFADTGYGDNAGSVSFRVESVFQGDTDLDGVLDQLDTDSDNDGIPDALEANSSLLTSQIDAHGRLTGAVNGTTGVPNLAGSGFASTNNDGDSIPNIQDIDSDNDGIVDVIEAQPTFSYIAPTGLDADADGIDNAFDVNFNAANSLRTTLRDTDGDGTPDMFDLNSDNDALTDAVEAAQGTYVAADTDGDGLANVFDDVVLSASPGTNATNGGQTAINPFPVTDNPGGQPNWRNNLCTQAPNNAAATNFGSVGISTHTVKQSSWPTNIPNGVLVLESSTKGFVVTRITTAARDAGSFVPVEGMLIYNTTENRFQLRKSGGWVNLKRGCNN